MFLWKPEALRDSRKIFMGVVNMFSVCKTFSQIRGTQRTLIQNRVTSQTFFMEAKVKCLYFLGKSGLNESKSPQKILCFCVSLRLWEPPENFSWELGTCSGYVKHSPRSGEHSAFWVRTVRCLNHFLLEQTSNFCILGKIGSQQAKITSEYSMFLWKPEALRGSRKFFMGVVNMFWVCKTFS